MIKLCFIINNLKMGGAERQFVELIKHIDKTKFEVTLFVYAENEPLFYKEVEKFSDIKLIRQGLHSKFKLLKIIKAVYQIRKFLIVNKFDIIQTTLVLNGAIIRTAALGLSYYKNRIVTSLRSNFDNYSNHEKLIERIFIKNSYCVANTKHSAKRFKVFCRDMYNSKIIFIYNGFNIQKFNIKKQVNNTVKIIGNVGRMQEHKNQLQILKALKTSGEISSLYIIGDTGPQKSVLESYINKNGIENQIQLLSNIQKIENYYKIFDIFILSSLYEGCPNALFEAMISKCLCIISEKANTDNFIQHSINGLVYDNSDAGLAECIKKAHQLFGTPKGEKIITNGFKFACQIFSIEKMTDSYADFYEHILHQPINIINR